MSQTREIRWLGAREASAMNLVTDPVGKALSRVAITCVDLDLFTTLQDALRTRGKKLPLERIL